MIDTQAIRSKILDLAMRGQLTEQLPEDGNAEELYQQILEEKQKLIKEGKIKKQKPLPDITKDKALNTIPANWKYVVLGTIITLQSGQDLKSEDYNSSENGIPYLTGASNFYNNNKLIINRWTASPKSIAFKNDILLSCKGTVGKIAILDEERVHIARQFMAIRSYKVNVRYVAYFMRSVIEGIKKASKGLIPGIERNDVLNLSFPLPPLAEQQRIVEKIEQAFSILDTIDELQAQYADNLTALKSKLIDAAIQGKLTEQLPEDGTAEELYQQIQEEKQKLIKEGKIKKQKPLPEISDEEIPFDIPDNWKWVRLANICYSISAGKDKPKDYVTVKDENHTIPVVANATTNDGIMGYTSVATAYAGSLTVAGRGTIGFTCYRDYDYCPIVRLLVINLSESVFPQYIKYVFQRLTVDSVGSSIPQLTVPMIRPKPIPLPPLAEQKRIVQKLNEILPLCE